MGTEAVTTRNFFPELQRNVTSAAGNLRVVSYTSDLGSDVPIVTLIHGYPQSAFWQVLVYLHLTQMEANRTDGWRHV